MSESSEQNLKHVPILPLRDVVVYPHMVIPLFVGREKSISALDSAMESGKTIMLVAQKQPDIDSPTADDIYRIGTLATILQLLKLPDGTVKVLVEGASRARVSQVHDGEYFGADIELIAESEEEDSRELDGLKRTIVSQFENYVKLNKKVPPEIRASLASIEQPGRLADTVAAHMSLQLDER